jgi:arylsulfate sulfotransferase
MQITIKIRGILKIIIFFGIILPSVLYFFYKSFLYVRREAIIYLKTNKVFKYTFETKDTSKQGYILITPSLPANLDYGKIVIVDLNGNKILERQIQGVVSDFRQWNVRGRIRYSYMVHDTDVNQVLAAAGSARKAVILDSALNEIKQLRFLPQKEGTNYEKQGLDHHDLIMLSDNHFITMSLWVKNVNNIPAYLIQSHKTRIAAPLIQEILNDSLVWQWDGSRYPELYENSTMGNKFYDTLAPQDYAHMNSMFIDPNDSNLILSLHNNNQVIKVSRHTGDILWRLGGRNSDFELTVEQVFLRQHHATMIDSGRTLLLFDNGEKSARPYSRILEFGLDEANKRITSFKAYKVPGPFAGTRGSVQKIGNSYYICGGSANYVLEMDCRSGEKVMELKTNQPLYRAHIVQNIDGILAGKK